MATITDSITHHGVRLESDELADECIVRIVQLPRTSFKLALVHNLASGRFSLHALHADNRTINRNGQLLHHTYTPEVAQWNDGWDYVI
jgi:hypothetical protein